MEGEDGDDKKRSILISRLTIPQSIAYALGPYLALQVQIIYTDQIKTRKEKSNQNLDLIHCYGSYPYFSVHLRSTSSFDCHPTYLYDIPGER